VQISDDLFLGPALGPQPSGVGLMPSPMEKGVGPMGRIYVFDVVPLTLQATGLATAQAVSGSTNLTLTAGTGVTRITQYNGALGYSLDCARCVTLVSANAGDTTQTATVSGFDFYGAPMTATVSLNGTTTVVTTKAFKVVTTINISATTTGLISAGFNDRLGLPVRVTDAGYLARVGWNLTLAENAGTFVAAVTTDPATAATGDVRGLFTPSTAADGTKRLVMGILMPALACGPNATRAGAYGVTQF
jgi:hypothetical protein